MARINMDLTITIRLTKKEAIQLREHIGKLNEASIGDTTHPFYNCDALGQVYTMLCDELRTDK